MKKYNLFTQSFSKLLILILTLAFILMGCGSNTTTTAVSTTVEITSEVNNTTTETTTTQDEASLNSPEPNLIELSDKDIDSSFDDATTISLSNNASTIDGSGASVSGNEITISEEGTYVFSGTLEDGYILIAAEENADVHIVLDNVSITNSAGPAIMALSGDKLIVTLAPNSINQLTDGMLDSATATYNAALYSEIDLTFNGTGSLSVTGNTEHAIFTKDDLKVVSGTFDLTSKGDALKGRDSVQIVSGQFKINAAGDAIQSSNDEDASKGWIIIEGGDFIILTDNDAIKAETDMTITGGNFEITAGDDGLTATGTLTVSGGIITITESYEGIEAQHIIINDGEITLTSSDDGINAASDSGQNDFTVNGGYLRIYAEGDGLDSNGTFTINGGIVIVDGPTITMNGALDYDGTGIINGGTLIAAGSLSMAEAPSEGSSQPAIMIYFSSNQAGGTEVAIMDASGNVVVSHTPSKNFQTIVFSAEGLSLDGTYTLTVNGTQTASLTLTSSVMTFSETGEAIEGSFGQMPGGQMPGGQKPTRP